MWLRKNFSMKRTTFVPMNSCLLIGITRMVYMPVRLPPRISVKSWSPTTAISCGSRLNWEAILRKARRRGLIALEIQITPSWEDKDSTRDEVLLETMAIFKPVERTLATQFTSVCSISRERHGTRVLSRSAMMALKPCWESCCKSIL